MSNDSEINLNDLSGDWQFLPSWAQETPAAEKYARYSGGEGERPSFRDSRGPGGFGGGGGRGGGRPPQRGGPGGPPRRDGGPQRGGPGGPRGDFRRDDRGGHGGQGPREGDRFERRPELPPLPELNAVFRPDARGLESLARQLKVSARAYPLFQIAQMILEKPERHSITLSVVKGQGGAIVQPLFLCALDDTLWLSEKEVVAYALEKHFATFYQEEKTPCDPPKGTYTFVAQCGLSGVILGPPNHHDYQNSLHRLHTERFGRMPFETFKMRVKIVKDEAVVKKWLEDLSFKLEFNCLNVAEPLRLASRDDVEKHFHQVHAANLVKPVESHTIVSGANRAMPCRPLATLLRVQLEDQRRFPLQLATLLSQLFASHGLQFFKREKTITHVCVARPHYIDLETTPVSAGVKRIIEFVSATPKCTRKILIDSLAPSAAPVAPVEGVPAEKPQPTAEQSTLLADLHWVLHQGHVIEFSSGLMETAKRPLPKLVKEPKPAPAPRAPRPPKDAGYLPAFNIVAGLVY